MKGELLLRIRDAETAAAKRIADAEKEAEKVVTEAHREADRIVADGRAKADKEFQETVAASREGFAAEEKKVLAAGKRQATTLRKQFEEGVDGATDRVVKLFERSL